VSQYGESPYTASVSVFGLLPADAAEARLTNTTHAAPSAMNFLMSTPPRSMVAIPGDATKSPTTGGLPARFAVVTKLVRAASSRAGNATSRRPRAAPTAQRRFHGQAEVRAV